MITETNGNNEKGRELERGGEEIFMCRWKEVRGIGCDITTVIGIIVVAINDFSSQYNINQQ